MLMLTKCQKCKPSLTVLHFAGRTQDVTESVRKLAYHILAEKVSIKSFTIAQRVQLLSNGLLDRSESIKDLCAKELLGGWLKSFDKDIIKLLKCLDVEGCTDVAELSLKAILKGELNTSTLCVHQLSRFNVKV